MVALLVSPYVPLFYTIGRWCDTSALMSRCAVLWWNRHFLPALGYFFNILYPVAANDAIIVKSLVGSRNRL